MFQMCFNLVNAGFNRNFSRRPMSGLVQMFFWLQKSSIKIALKNFYIIAFALNLNPRRLSRFKNVLTVSPVVEMLNV